MNGTTETFVDTERAAALLGLSPRTLECWRVERTDGPPFCKLGRKAVKYRVSDLESWAADRLRRSTSDTGPAAPPPADNQGRRLQARAGR